MDGIIRIDKVAAILDVWLDTTFPFAKMKVKVLGRSSDFLAVPNLIFKNPISGNLEYISGLGSTVEEAVDDLLVRFVADIRSLKPNTDLTEADFEWSAPEEF